jgi:nucleotide-binding universal stress UspA family protein
VGTHLRRGRPAKEVVGLAEELGADLVVVGSGDWGRSSAWSWAASPRGW